MVLVKEDLKGRRLQWATCVLGAKYLYCPTNGDPNYEVKRKKPPTGIPRSMLMVTPDGSYLLPSGAAAVLKPKKAAFEEEILRLPSTQHVRDLPPELRCPLCKEVMKDAVFTRKCCFRSFCDKCIQEYIITNSTCVCGTMDVLADDLIPIKALRDAIIHILKSTTTSTMTNSTSSDNGGSVVHVTSIESTRHVHSKAPSSSRAAAVKDEMHCLDRKTTESTNMSESTLESVNIKETASPDGLLVPQEVPAKLPENKQGKKMKKKEVNLHHRATNVLLGKVKGYYTMMPSAPLACGRYMAPFGAGTPFMGYPFGTFDSTFDRMLSQNQFAAQFRMMSAVLPRELSELAVNSVGINRGNPTGMNEFEPRKSDFRNQHKFEQHGEREHSRDDEDIGGDGGGSSAKGAFKRR